MFVVLRPKQSDWQSALYNGKYGTHVLKVQVSTYMLLFRDSQTLQVMCDFSGTPVFFSGPHIGVRSDIRLWQEHGAALDAGELVLADKAYVSKDVNNILAPYKKKKRENKRQQPKPLSRAKKDFNLLHR